MEEKVEETRMEAECGLQREGLTWPYCRWRALGDGTAAPDGRRRKREGSPRLGWNRGAARKPSSLPFSINDREEAATSPGNTAGRGA